MALQRIIVSGNSGTTNTTTFTTDSFFSGAGDRVIVLILACDNSVSGGGNPILANANGSTHTPPITFTQIASREYNANAAANGGVAMAYWYAILPNSTANTSGTVTFNFSNTTRAKTYQAYVVNGATSYNTVIGAINNSGVSGGNLSNITTTVAFANSGNLVIGTIARESNTVINTYDLSSNVGGDFFAINESAAVISNANASIYLGTIYKPITNTNINSQTMTATFPVVSDCLTGYISIRANIAATAPLNLTVTADNKNGYANISWVMPVEYGGSSPTDYVVQYRTPAGSGAWTNYSHSASTALSSNVSGLTNGQSYEIQVAALTGYGVGAFSNSIAVQPVLLGNTNSTLTYSSSFPVRHGWGQDAKIKNPLNIINWSYAYTTDGPRFKYLNLTGSPTTFSNVPSELNFSNDVTSSNGFTYRSNGINGFPSFASIGNKSIYINTTQNYTVCVISYYNFTAVGTVGYARFNSSGFAGALASNSNVGWMVQNGSTNWLTIKNATIIDNTRPHIAIYTQISGGTSELNVDGYTVTSSASSDDTSGGVRPWNIFGGGFTGTGSGNIAFWGVANGVLTSDQKNQLIDYARKRYNTP